MRTDPGEVRAGETEMIIEWVRTLLILILVSLAFKAYATERSSTERHRFVQTHACPSTHKHRLPCPGYIVDHVVPLCAGGADYPGNMQWQTVAEAKAKDKEEWRLCRELHKSR
jgi:hypothetical protein